ncbi:MAG: Uma2 family endonuclease [Candidatus Schekmanbacteria bacterium]|nr:Uma2 family endonuclease [Candidatus Schekmanbacteria bacterium]
MSSAPLSRIPPEKIRLTYAEYLELPDDGKRYEIIDGELNVTPAPTSRHQIVAANFHLLLGERVRTHRLGRLLFAPVDVVLSDTDIVQPDLVFIRADRTGIIAERFIQGSPDLVIEILSPTTRRRDILTKSALYARFQVPSYWLVDPDIDQVSLYWLDGDRYRLGEETRSPEVLRPGEFSGLELPLEELFA